MRKKFENGELSIEELEKLGLATFDDEYGEEGEFEMGEDYDSEEGGEKKAKHEWKRYKSKMYVNN